MEAANFKNSLSRRKLYGETMRIDIDAIRSPSSGYGRIFYTQWLVHNDWVGFSVCVCVSVCVRVCQ